MITSDHKKKFIAETLAYLAKELAQADAALNTTKDYSKSSDLKQEGKYDTRAIEAGYLVGAQKKRVEELKRDIAILSKIDEKVLKRSETIAVFNVVALLDENDNLSYYFLCPTPAPSFFQMGAIKITPVTLESPLGQALVNLKAGDDFSVELGATEKEYLVESIF